MTVTSEHPIVASPNPLRGIQGDRSATVVPGDTIHVHHVVHVLPNEALRLSRAPDSARLSSKHAKEVYP